MPEPLTTKVSIGETYGSKKAPNIILEDARFYGRPNFAGELDRFKDDRRKFTVLIPADVADQLRQLGYNVKDKVNEENDPDFEPFSFMKVMVDFRFSDSHPGDVNHEKGPDIWLIMGETREKLTSKTAGVLDRARVRSMDMEVRGWEYDPEDSAGMLSARLVTLVATVEPTLLNQKYGMLG